jgi:aryl-alcohol dehydrogenase-like predicted oxidoreductase
MQHAMLGSLRVSRIGLGAMTMAGTYTSGGGLDDAESIRAIHSALDLGVTHIDTAESYGPFHSEEIVGQALEGRRDQVVVATKFGILSHSGRGAGPFDSSPANIRTADGVILTADQLQRLDNITPATGARHDEINMASIDR